MLARFLLVLLCALAWPGAAFAQEAFTNRDTELKERGAADARTVANVPADTPVKVGERGGGWARVDAGGGRSGWVRIFHLRFPATAEGTRSSGGGLAAVTGALGFGRERSRESTIATTGIRGLSPEDLKNASPDPQELKRLQSFRADQAAAERFAREGRLAAVQVDVEAGSR
jgi:SH3 domain-containing protein